MFNTAVRVIYTVSSVCLTKLPHALAPTALNMMANTDSETAELIEKFANVDLSVKISQIP